MYAIVPAHNEEPSVGGVVRALVEADVFDEILVIDDGSTDRTGAVAAAAGARVLRPPRNLGKGGAMLLGYQAVLEQDPTHPGVDDRVAFFDSDLDNLSVAQIHRMVAASELGFDQVCGVLDFNAVANILSLCFQSLITGQRIVRRWVLDALPPSCWKGYAIEVAMNDVVQRNGGLTQIMLHRGLRQREKYSKVGYLAGLRQQVKMYRQISRTRRALRESGGMSCEI